MMDMVVEPDDAKSRETSPASKRRSSKIDIFGFMARSPEKYTSASVS